MARAKRSTQRNLSLAVGAVVAFAVHVILLHQAYTWRGNTHPDFFIEWMGSRVALSGGNPYSEQTTLAIQLGSKGHEVPPDQDQLAFVYPFYRVFFNAPVAFLPYDWATAIWHTAMQFSLLTSVLLFVQSLRWHTTPGEFALVILLAILPYPLFGGLMLGQMAVGVLALLLFSFWSLQQRRDWLAGICLACATVKPQLVVLAVPGLLLWSLARRRWRVVAGFVLSLALLLGVSFLIYPDWLRAFLHAASRYASYKPTETGASFLLSDYCAPAWPWVLETAAVVGLLASWWAAWRQDEPRSFEGAFVLTLAMTTFVLPQTSPVDRMLLLPAILLLVRDIQGWLGQVALVILTIAGTWLSYALLYRSHYGLNMALPPVVALTLLALWYTARHRQKGQEAKADLA